jgi:hypothetical protein
MKLHFLPSVAAASLLMMLPMGANAQEKQQKKLHIVIEENGTVTKDTSVTFDKSLSEKEVQEIISGITGETPYPCPAHKYHVMHGDTMVNKCGHMKKGELDSLLEASGHSFKYPDTDSCRHGQEKKCLKEISEGERAEKTIITESPEKTEKSKQKQK